MENGTNNYERIARTLEEYIQCHAFSIMTSKGRVIGQGALNKTECEEEGITLDFEPKDPERVKFIPLGAIDVYGTKITLYAIAILEDDTINFSVRMRLYLAGDIYEFKLSSDTVKAFERAIRRSRYIYEKEARIKRLKVCRNIKQAWERLRGATLADFLHQKVCAKSDSGEDGYESPESDFGFL